MIRSAFVVMCLAAAFATAQDSAPASRPSADAACDLLRTGHWTPENVEAAFAGLSAEGAAFAIDWWGRAAEAPAIAPKLPVKTRALIKDARKTADPTLRPGKDARAIWTAAAEHARKMIDKKFPVEAANAVSVLEALGGAYPAESWARDAADLKKRVSKIPPQPKEAPKEAEKATTADLTKRALADLDLRGAKALAEYLKYGNLDGYMNVRRWIRLRDVDEASHKDYLAFSAASRRFGIAKELRVSILGDAHYRVRHGGGYEPIGEEKLERMDARKSNDIVIDGLPGEVVSFEIECGKDAMLFHGRDGTEFNYAELFIHATYDKKDVPREWWSAFALQNGRIAYGGLMWAKIGPNKGLIINDEPAVCMNYAESGKPPIGYDGTIYIDATKSEEEMQKDFNNQIFADLLNPSTIVYGDRHTEHEAHAVGDKSKYVWTIALRDKVHYAIFLPDLEMKR